MRPPSWNDVPLITDEWLGEVLSLRDSDPSSSQNAWRGSMRASSRSTRFLDGNGRTGRLVLNLLLVRLGYPPAIIYKRDRTRYLNALRRADQGDYGALGEMLARAVLDNLYKFVVPAIAGPARLVPLPVLASDEISADALRVAAARGRLKASRGPDGMWRSSRGVG